MAAFPLTVTTDIYGTRHVANLQFQGAPALSDVILAVERDAKQQEVLRGMPFQVQALQVYDDALQRWSDLHNPSQLRPGAQLFAFQPAVPHTPAVRDQTLLPLQAPTVLGSPSRARIAAELGIDAAMSERLRRLYAEMEVNSVLPVANLRDYFARHGVAWTAAAVGDLVSQSDALQFVEWARWGMSNPQVIDSLYFDRFAVRLDKPLYTIPDHVPPSGSEVENLAAMRAREEELRRSTALGWTADREAADRHHRAQRKAELNLQIRHLTTKNKLDRIRATERADADAASLSLAMIANAASPVRKRDDLCRMYYNTPSPKLLRMSP